MSSVDIIRDTVAVERKLEELRSMLETAKASKSAVSMIPLIEDAIEAHEGYLRNIQFAAERQRNTPKRIILRATHLAYWAKDRHCLGIYYPVDNHYIFELEQTKRWFDICKFLPRVGYLLIPEDSNCKYVVTSVSYRDKRPKRTIFTAVPANVA